ncbi:MAG TPA: hypothetical protein VF094_04475 [Gaiellaceae bacterium]
MRLLGGGFLAALVIAAAAAAATTPPLPLHVLKRPAHGYDKLPSTVKGLGAVQESRRVATAVDKKHNGYLVYVTLMKDKSLCVVLAQGRSYSARCSLPAALFSSTTRTFSVVKGLIGGVAADGVKKVVLVGRTTRKTLPLTSDGGYIYGCPAPTNCATWVREVLAYNAAGKLISTERTH